MKKPIKILLAVLLILILIVGAYAAYVFITYYRIEDNQPLTAEGQGAAGDTVPTSKEMTLTSWNIGFGAYTEQFSFFMDGGKYSRGFSEEIVKDTVISMSDTLKEMQSDFIFLQEVDIDATRSYHIDQRKIMQSALNNMSSVFALNYDSPYLFWPLLEPHGKSVAGILTLSNYDISTGLRRSLPIQTDFAKLIDLDRCYTVSRVPTENGKELLLYNVHLSAYTTDPTIADKQLDMLYEDMAGEYQKGWIQVQDMSSSFVAQAAPLKPGDYVIDVCGAPGGKSLHVADRLKGTGMVDVRDLSLQKVALIEENIERTGFANIKARVQDALEPDPESFEKADVLIADLPCSGLGIIGKKPDIKWNMTEEKTTSLVKLQRDILSVVHRYVKPGGFLIYSTCTINPKENQENAKWFREQFPFEPVNIEGWLGEKIMEDSMKEGYLQLLPGIHPCDGFFLSVFRRKQ